MSLNMPKKIQIEIKEKLGIVLYRWINRKGRK